MRENVNFKNWHNIFFMFIMNLILTCSQGGQYQFPSGMTIRGGLRHDACHPRSQRSQRRIHSGWSDCPHFWQLWSTSSSSSSTSSSGSHSSSSISSGFDFRDGRPLFLGTMSKIQKCGISINHKILKQNQFSINTQWRSNQIITKFVQNQKSNDRNEPRWDCIQINYQLEQFEHAF